MKNKSQKTPQEQIRHTRQSSGPKLNYNIKSINFSNNNKMLNSSTFIYKNNKKTKSVPKDNNRIIAAYNYNNKNNSFIGNKRVKTPLLTRNENDLKRNKDNLLNKSRKNNNYHLNININENKSFRNHNNIFQPVNIFSQFKRNKVNNNEEIVKNSQLFKKFLNKENKIKNNYENNKINIINNNNNNKNINNSFVNNNTNNENISSNIINNTNDTTQINSGNLLNNKSNSNHNLNFKNKMNKIVFDKNIDCHEINFHVNGISSSINLKNNFKQKKKIFKGKKIKCMHDLSKTGLSGDDKKVK